MRSLLFVPGDSERKLERGFTSGADVVVVDLEDSIAPQNKAYARTMAADFIAARRDYTKAAIYVRINDLGTGITDDDLRAIMPVRPHGIMLPKSNSGMDVQHLSAKLRVHETEHGLPDGSTMIIPIITETAAGVFATNTYAGASARLAGLTWGTEDLSTAIGACTARDNVGRYTDVFRLARSMTILGAATANTAAIDTVFVNFRDPNVLKTESIEAAYDGFTAKMAVHPNQVAIINEAFTPTDKAVAYAASIVAAFEKAGNPGVVGIDGKMYDQPHLRLAQRLLARARAAGVGI